MLASKNEGIPITLTITSYIFHSLLPGLPIGLGEKYMNSTNLILALAMLFFFLLSNLLSSSEPELVDEFWWAVCNRDLNKIELGKQVSL